ncbi:MAG: sigma-54-dependent Fis family transcriptional regulator, partial [Planctomycetota bacterium]
LKRISPSGIGVLMSHHWPGNIRELKNVIERSAIICEKDVLDKEDILLDGTSTTLSLSSHNHLFDFNYHEAKDEFIRLYIHAVLEKANYNVTKAAKIAGIMRSSFHKLMKKYEVNSKG